MRADVCARLRDGRVRTGPYASTDDEGLAGSFAVGSLHIMSSGPLDDEWEHVSVSRDDRCPTWDEMSRVKRWFWDDEEAVMQLHPPLSSHVNQHPFCLHLWRPKKAAIPLPPTYMV